MLKTANGKRATIKPSEIETRKISEVSLMPDGLAQQMREQQLVDLLAYLATLRQPVSIVGQFGVAGPVDDTSDSPAIDPAKPVKSAEAKKLVFRRLNANAEGVADLVPVLGPDAKKAAYLHTPVTSPADQQVTIVLDTQADIRAWIGGKPLNLPAHSAGEPRSVTIAIAKGTTDLLIRVPGGNAANVVATFVAGKPLEFSPTEAAPAGR